MFGIEKKIAAAARKAALLSAGGVLACVGAAFLTVAAWLVLAELRSDIFAATVIGVVYMGLALIFVAVASADAKKVKINAVVDQNIDGLSPLQLMAVSLLEGFEQGARAKRKS